MDQQSSDSPSPDSDESGQPSQSRRQKKKSKVWEKVVWFTRKSRSKDTGDQSASLDDESGAYSGYMDYDDTTGPVCDLPMDQSTWCESNSSSDIENLDSPGTSSSIKKSNSYPNSEVIEQHCLKPSIARALFQQIEASNLYPKPVKPAWQKRKKSAGSNLEPLNINLVDTLRSQAEERLDNIYLKDSPRHCVNCCPCQCDNYEMQLQDVGASCVVRNAVSSLKNVCKKRPMAFNENLDHISACKKRSSFSSLLDLYHSQSHVTLFSSLPSHYGSRTKSNTCRGFGRPHLCMKSELWCDSKVSVCTHSECHTKRKPEAVVEEKTSNKLTKDLVSPQEFSERISTMKKWFHQFNDEQKNIVLKEMLGDCDLPQIHLLSLEMEPRLHKGCPNNCQDLITWLPPSIALYIFSFLDPVSLCRASAVCHVWNVLTNEQCLWQKFCYQTMWRLSPNGEQKQLLHHMLPDGNIHWKKVFAERFRLRNNWLKGRCHVRTFEGHTQGISCVQFDDTRIVSGSSDKTIKVWNIRTNTPWSVQTLVGHSGTVRCLNLDGNRLVSGSTDCSIKVWDLSMQQSWSSIACKVTLTGHTDTVRCLQVDDEKVVSGSYDHTLKIWDIKTGLCKMTLRGHEGAVLCVQFDDEKLMSGSCDKTIKFWNQKGECTLTLQGHHDAVTCLQFDHSRIVSGSLDCNLKFWDIHTGQCINTIDWKASEGHTGVVRCLQADSWRVVSASDDRTLKVWNLETGERLTTLRNHTDGVTCLQFSDSIIVSGSYDKTVKLWDFSCC